MGSIEFEVLSPEEAAMVKAMRDGRQRIGVTQALIGGATIWFPRRTVNNFYRMLAARGYQLHTRYAEKDGVKGTYLWAEKVEATQP